MKKLISTITIAIFLFAMIAPVLARSSRRQGFRDRRSGESQQSRPNRGNRSERQNRPNRREMLKRFDTDGDGKLDENECSAAKAALGEQKEKMHQKFDANGDGKLDQDEKQALQKELKQKRRKKLDTDGDGTVSDEEKAVGLKHHLSQMKQNKPDKYNKFLERFDTNNDGELDVQEMGEANRSGKNNKRRSQHRDQNQDRPEKRNPRTNQPSDEKNDAADTDNDNDLSFMDGI